jgi:hypothetical protein
LGLEGKEVHAEDIKNIISKITENFLNLEKEMVIQVQDLKQTRPEKNLPM